MTTLTDQLTLSKRVLQSMRTRGGSADDIRIQTGVVATVEKVKMFEEITEQMRADGFGTKIEVLAEVVR